MKHCAIFALALLSLLPGQAYASGKARSEALTLKFSGCEWEVRSAGLQGPGPNQWDSANVFVDKKGWLHLKITRAGDEWRCAELTTKQRLGFGRYQFQVAGRIDQLDRNIVLGLFNYPTPDVGADGTNEIDIEFAHWGRAGTDIGNYTVWPGSGKAVEPENHHTFPFTLTGDNSTHRFLWKPGQVSYRSVHGHRNDDKQEIAHWDYTPSQPRLIPQSPMPLHLNLWLFRGMPPSDSKPVEIVIKQFTFTPLEKLK